MKGQERTHPQTQSKIDTLKGFKKEGQAKTIQIKRIGKEEKRYGRLVSGASHNLREIKKDENYQDLVPVE